MEMELRSTTVISRMFLLLEQNSENDLAYNQFNKSGNEFLLLFQNVSMKTGP